MQSMDDMMNMSFDELRANVNPGVMPTTGGRGAALSFHGAAPSLLAGPPPAPVVPDHPHELDVYLSGPGAESACAGAPRGQLAALASKQAQEACAGKRDFILFEDLDNAGAQRSRCTRSGSRHNEPACACHRS